ncbi:serine/threonine-protein kinase [Chondromyces apiculatus]|uniref:non-specific serine/threonine protein kinase n=1 Tax=Chondromyces apiculatus DSM 436 TaxID=1192034 RepID=A0A017TAR9_9BACT|nr:serine/threonine-protein kinase [Chondromyces apiculatus]EYF05920.1 serine/threonine protein kinase [Chondromyces apiculatus DSM 436]
MSTGSPRPEFAGTRRFEVVRRIGRGGSGVVYEAFDRERSGRVALKVLRALDPEARLRFKAEFRSLQDLHHPNLVSLGELHDEDGQLFFTMELVRGVDFMVYVRQHFEGDVEPPSSLGTTRILGDAGAAGPRPTGDAQPRSSGGANGAAVDSTPVGSAPPASTPVDSTPADSVSADSASSGSAPVDGTRQRRRNLFDETRLRDGLRQLLRGLGTLHDARKVHRDIKPSNVLVDVDGRVVILDFGLLADISAPRRNDPIAGTAHYIAPEQIDGSPAGPEADLYSVGVMLHLALTGEYPFRSSPAMAMRLKRLVMPPPPGDLAEGLPADLEQLCVALLHIDPAARPTAREVLRRLQGEDLDEEPPATSLRNLFVGRTRELDVLDRAFADARLNRAVAQLIAGESGVGKTSLMRRFLERIAGDALTLAARCQERESVPYKALDGLIDALSDHLAALPDAEVRALLPPRASLLGAAFPVLRQVPALDAAEPSPHVVDPAEQRVLTFAVMRALFGALAQRSPVVLAIDDLQWADADSLALLAEIMRPEPGRHVLLVGVVRSGAGMDASQLGTRLGLPADAVHHLALQRLPPADAEALCAVLLRGAAPRRPISVRTLAEESGGHPLFIDALVRYRLTHEEHDVPTRLDDVLGARIALLDPRSRELLDLASVAGGPLYLDVAARAARADLGELTRITARLRGANLVRVGGTGRGELLEPYHSRIRDAVLAALGAGAERELHGRLAQALEATHRLDLTALAAHWRAAGDPLRAAGYALQAGAQAEAALAFERAAQLYRTAVTLLPPDAENRRAALLRLGSALSSAGQGVKAAEAYMAATEGASPAESLELGRRAAQSLLRAGYVAAGLAALRTVLSAADLGAPHSPQALGASIVSRRVALRRRGLDFTARPASAIPAEDLARIDVCWTAALGLAIVDPIQGAHFQEQNLRLALEAGEPYRVTRALAMEAAYLAGETSPGPRGARKAVEVATLIARASTLADSLGSPHARGLVRLADGIAATYLGRWSSARSALDEAERIFREQCTGVAWERGAAQSCAIWALWYLGDVSEFTRRVPIYLQEARERGDTYLEATARSAQGNAVWLLRGDPDTALREAEVAINSWSRAGYHLQSYFDLLARAQIALYRGDGQTALRLFVERWPSLEASGALKIQSVRVAMEHLRACATLVAADSVPGLAEAQAQVSLAAQRLDREQSPWATALATTLRAALAATGTVGTASAASAVDAAGAAGALGNAAAASRLFAGARQIFEDAGMDLYAAAALSRAGELAGDADGAALVTRAERWMTDRAIPDPARITATLLPLPPQPPTPVG